MYTPENTRLLYLVGFDFLLFSAQNSVVTEHAIIPNNPPTAMKTSWFSYSKILKWKIYSLVGLLSNDTDKMFANTCI